MKDTVCECVHWFEEHDKEGCYATACECEGFVFDPELNTPGAIVDRGGDHSEQVPPCTCQLCQYEAGVLS